jgi:hypothetical protein
VNRRGSWGGHRERCPCRLRPAPSTTYLIRASSPALPPVRAVSGPLLLEAFVEAVNQLWHRL